MGTRHLIAVVHDGKCKLAQYGQWDGYPSGQGLTSLNFARTIVDAAARQAFAEKLRAARFITDAEAQAINAEIKADPSLFKEGKKYGHFSRDRGAKILRIVADAEPGILLQDNINFAADSLFCEWAYVIDLDKNTLEVFKGFNKEPLSQVDRFFDIQKSGEEYKPVKLAKSYPLDSLPSEDQFMADLEPQEEGEEA